jgi:hypothetical protein
MKIDPDFALGMESMDFVHGLSQEPIKNPYIWSSSSWMLFEAGRVWNRCGRSTPVMARKSRGYSVRIDTADNRFVVNFVGDDLDSELRRL